MADWFLETGLFLLGVALIPAGLLLVCRGVWGDQSKGRVRCPKCWYDMRGTVPKLECPECGHDAGQESQLYKHHRRWRPIVLGIVLVLLSAYPLASIYLFGAALIPAVGLLLICWGWWGRRPRCRKCWYGMRGSLPRLECPECGQDAGSERRLDRNRRTWRRIALGAVLLSCFPLNWFGSGTSGRWEAY